MHDRGISKEKSFLVVLNDILTPQFVGSSFFPCLLPHLPFAHRPMQLHKLEARKAGKKLTVSFSGVPTSTKGVRLNHAIFMTVSELILTSKAKAPRDLVGLRVPDSGYTWERIVVNVSGMEDRWMMNRVNDIILPRRRVTCTQSRLTRGLFRM